MQNGLTNDETNAIGKFIETMTKEEILSRHLDLSGVSYQNMDESNTNDWIDGHGAFEACEMAMQEYSDQQNKDLLKEVEELKVSNKKTVNGLSLSCRTMQEEITQLKKALEEKEQENERLKSGLNEKDLKKFILRYALNKDTLHKTILNINKLLNT